MATRSSRYLDEDVSTRPKLTRANKNKYLYNEVNNKIAYEEIDTLEMYDGIELDCDSPIKTREEYQRIKDETRKEKDVVDVNEEFEESKVYDINSILEEAKKKRVIPDELEKKRKLQNVEYNILNDLNQKYINKKEKLDEELEKEGIRELIDTITSKNLSSDLKGLKDVENEEDADDDLMSDLLATNTMNAIEGISLEEDIAKDILIKETVKDDDDENDEIVEEDGRLVNSFYTRSMDLSEHDFEIRDEIIEENKDKRKILILVILIILVIIAIVALFILKKINVI